MKTVFPEQTVDAAQSWVLYDGDCSLCTRMARRCEDLLRRNGFQLAALPTGAEARVERDTQGRPAEMMVVLPDGRALGGADGLMQIARRVWWAWPVYALGRVPGMMAVFRAAYRYIADRRTCMGNVCQPPREQQKRDWLTKF